MCAFPPPCLSIPYSSVIGSQETQPMSVIEQPLQQIMKTPTIFQEPATQLTKPKKKSTYSDAVGKRLPTSETGSFSAANKVGVVGNQPVGLSLPPPPSQPKLNLAPGSRPTVNDSGAMVRVVVCLFLPTSQPHTADPKIALLFPHLFVCMSALITCTIIKSCTW